ncbi:hypothetical protein TNCV_5015371 [Trichonephila clavipes]|nr:hypothetical protein TNCV_5015371 [Trichonephila clavipes]
MLTLLLMLQLQDNFGNFFRLDSAPYYWSVSAVPVYPLGAWGGHPGAQSDPKGTDKLDLNRFSGYEFRSSSAKGPVDIFCAKGPKHKPARPMAAFRLSELIDCLWQQAKIWRKIIT